MSFLSELTGCFARPVNENPTVAMIEAAYQHHGLNWRYVNCEVGPEELGDAESPALLLPILGRRQRAKSLGAAHPLVARIITQLTIQDRAVEVHKDRHRSSTASRK